MSLSNEEDILSYDPNYIRFGKYVIEPCAQVRYSGKLAKTRSAVSFHQNLAYSDVAEFYEGPFFSDRVVKLRVRRTHWTYKWPPVTKNKWPEPFGYSWIS